MCDWKTTGVKKSPYVRLFEINTNTIGKIVWRRNLQGRVLNKKTKTKTKNKKQKTKQRKYIATLS